MGATNTSSTGLIVAAGTSTPLPPKQLRLDPILRHGRGSYMRPNFCSSRPCNFRANVLLSTRLPALQMSTSRTSSDSAFDAFRKVERYLWLTSLNGVPVLQCTGNAIPHSILQRSSIREFSDCQFDRAAHPPEGSEHARGSIGRGE